MAPSQGYGCAMPVAVKVTLDLSFISARVSQPFAYEPPAQGKRPLTGSQFGPNIPVNGYSLPTRRTDHLPLSDH
jgi:hypothetical protein